MKDRWLETEFEGQLKEEKRLNALMLRICGR